MKPNLLENSSYGNRVFATPLLATCRIHLERLLAARSGLHLDGASLQSLLHYLYTGDLVTSAADDAAPNGADCDVSGAGADVDLLLRLGQEFGTPNGLEHDLRYLMETGELADAVLVFASGSGQNDERPLAGAAAAAATSSATSATSSPSSSDYGFMPWLEIPCHRAILSARSPFFRSLIQVTNRFRRGKPRQTPSMPV